MKKKSTKKLRTVEVLWRAHDLIESDIRNSYDPMLLYLRGLISDIESGRKIPINWGEQ